MILLIGLQNSKKNIIESKGWNWKIVKDKKEKVWKKPSIESYYLLNRWKFKNFILLRTSNLKTEHLL